MEASYPLDHAGSVGVRGQFNMTPRLQTVHHVPAGAQGCPCAPSKPWEGQPSRQGSSSLAIATASRPGAAVHVVAPTACGKAAIQAGRGRAIVTECKSAGAWPSSSDPSGDQWRAAARHRRALGTLSSLFWGGGGGQRLRHYHAWPRVPPPPGVCLCHCLARVSPAAALVRARAACGKPKRGAGRHLLAWQCAACFYASGHRKHNRRLFD